MPFSIWEYLRERTRDSVLAGLQDALDIAEQADTEGSQHEAASRLRSRLAAGSLSASEAKQLPHPSTNGVAPQATTSPKAPTRPADASSFDDELESRFESPAAQNGQQPPQNGEHIGRARRGRPPKRRDGNA